MSVGHGMIWPLAAEYARRGWAVRRVGWANEITDPFDKDTSLRWIVHHHGLFHLTWLSKSPSFTGTAMTCVVRNTDFGVEEFLARDWTVYSPHCATVYDGWDQQGKEPYPTPIDIAPVSYPFPTTECPAVPPIVDPDDPDDCSVACGDPPDCGSNFQLVTGGFDTCGCRIYLCQPVHCSRPPECMPGFTPRVIGYNDLGCAIWYCAPDDRQPCDEPPVCGPGMKLVVTGVDARGCPIHACQPTPCADPPSCPSGETATFTGFDETGCAKWDCMPVLCGNPPICPAGFVSAIVGQDASGCPIYDCVAIVIPPPPPPPPSPPPPPPHKLQPAPITISNVTWWPTCFLDGTAPPFQIQLGFRVTLGAAPTPEADGIYWVSVYVHGKKIDTPNMTPGQSIDYSVAVQGSLGETIQIRANAYLPIKKLQSNDLHEFKFPKMCGSGCTNPYASNYNPEISDDDDSCITCASAGKCLPNDTDEGDNCNDVGNGCCDGYCETAGDCSPSFRQSFTAENGTYYPSCFG